MYIFENMKFYYNSKNLIFDLFSLKIDIGWSLNLNGSDDNYGICGLKMYVVNKCFERYILVFNFVNEFNKIYLKKVRVNDGYVLFF